MKKPQLNQWKFSVSLVFLALLAFINSASAAVLFTDNFTVLPGGVGNQDVNQALGNGRQTGPLASVSSGFFSTYTFGGDHHQVGNTTTDVGQPGGASNSGYVLLALGGGTFQSDLDIANVATGPLTIEVDMYNNGANPGGGADTQWVAFTLGVPGNTGPNSGGAGEFGFLKRANGGVQVFQNGSDIAAGALDVVGTATDDHWTVTFTDTAGTGSAFHGSGSKVTIQNGATVLGTYTLNQLKSTGLRLGFKCDGNRFAGIANLKISGTLTPAPTLSVLFHDNFNAYYGLNSDNNLNLNVDLIDRQSGLLAPNNYVAGPAHHQVGNNGTGVGQPFGSANSGYVLAAFNGNFYSGLDIPVISTGPLKLELDLYVNSNDWLALGLRHVPSDFFPIVGAGSGEFGFLRQSDGGLQLWDGSGSITPSGWNNAGFAPNNHMTFIFTDTAGTGSAFTGNGSRVTVMSGGTTLGTINLTQLSSSGLKLGFKADGGELGGIDNLTLSGTVPAVIAPNLVTDIQPRRSEVATGTPINLSVTVSGNPLNFQWYNQNGPITGATNSNYAFNAVAGNSSYYVAVTNTAGSIVSSTAAVISAANIVTVNNFSFENGSAPAFGNGAIPAQWTAFNSDWSTVASDTGAYSPAIVPDGTQYYAVNTGPSHSGDSGAYQDVGALQPNTTYTLTVAIGRRDDNGPGGTGNWSPGDISLVNGTDNTGTVLGTTTGYPSTAGTWQDYTVIFTTGSSVSGDLTIVLGVPPAGTYQGAFDNVRLTTGAPTAVIAQTILPAQAETFVGDQVVFTAAYNDSPTSTLQWVHIGSGLTNLVNTGVVNVDAAGVTTSTLTLSSVQLTDAGTYVLEAINATNSSAIAYTPAARLVVSTPTTAGNVVQKNSAQAGSYPYYPGWTVDTAADLIYNAGNSGAGAGNFGLESPLNGDPAVLTDGTVTDAKPQMVSCGWAQLNPSPGVSMTYTLPAGPTYGYELTNITVYGGWNDDGRNEQKYQVLYSTAASPSTFVSLGTFDYNPGFNNSVPNGNRVILVPLTGVLAHNVAAVQINFNMQSKNNWNGYSEITVGGTPSLGVLPALTQDISPLTAEDVVGSSLIMTASFSGATSYQWQKNGTNILGATSSTLTLNNLQLSDTATNGGYRLLGINIAGTNASRGCSLVVDPAPAATNNLITAFAIQTSDAGTLNPFSPTWDTTPLGASLIAGQNPPAIGYGAGNFTDPDVNYPNTAGGVQVLTDGNYGTFAYDGTHAAFATAGSPTSHAGQYVTYLLGANANGYTITNIQIAGGWNDDGRASQYYTVLYSTVANTNQFLPLAAVTKNLSSYGVNDSTAVRTTLTPATGVLASNVYAIEVDFEYPQGVPNGYSGYNEISVFGSPSTNPGNTGPQITAENQTGLSTPPWTVETPNLIANQVPSSHGAGVFTEEGCNVTNLTDGTIGYGFAFGASCGDDGTAVPWIVFNSSTGWNLTNIVVYSLWNDFGRDGQFYTVSYSTLAAPTTFLPLANVGFNPSIATGVSSANRVAIAPPIGQTLLASNVAAVKFDFTSQGAQDFGWTGYSEIVLQGSSVAAAAPPVVNPAKVSGGSLIVTGTGTPNFSYSVLTATNLQTPLANWIISATGVTDGTGAFSNSIPINVTNPASYFRVRMP